MPSLRYNYGDFALAVAGMSIIFDVVVLCFPLPVIKNLHLITRRKIMIASIFWLGGLYASPSQKPYCINRDPSLIRVHSSQLLCSRSCSIRPIVQGDLPRFKL